MVLAGGGWRMEIFFRLFFFKTNLSFNGSKNKQEKVKQEKNLNPFPKRFFFSWTQIALFPVMF